jgi:hypothetical protein
VRLIDIQRAVAVRDGLSKIKAQRAALSTASAGGVRTSDSNHNYLNAAVADLPAICAIIRRGLDREEANLRRLAAQIGLDLNA